MSEQKKLYYLVDEAGCVYCKDGGFHVNQEFAKFQAYKRLSAARTAAGIWGQYNRQRIRIMDNEGNEVLTDE